MNDQIDIYPVEAVPGMRNYDVFVIRITYAGNRVRVMIKTLMSAWVYSEGFNRALSMLKLPEVPVFEHDISWREHDIKVTCTACEERKQVSQEVGVG